jgi:hypothetical protein
MSNRVIGWPTPTAADAKKSGHRKKLYTLTDRALRGPHATMMSPDGDPGSTTVDLNPRFVEALMGLPLGWLTHSISAATDSFREWQRRHSPPWRLALAGG